MLQNISPVVLLLALGCSSTRQADRPRDRYELAAQDLAQLPRREVRVTEKDGKISLYGGVLLADVLSHIGVSVGVHPKGRPPVEYVLVEGADGYRALFAKAELDPAFSESMVLLADRHDGQPLASDDGPWRLVVPADKIRSRWVKRVSAIGTGSP